jgi:RNA polymerase sigma-70 factor (ECF subfamily)
VVDPNERRGLTERFLAASRDGDLEGLMSLLAPGVRLVGDGGGKSKAPLRVIDTADKAGRFLVSVAQRGILDPQFRFLEINGGTGLLLLSGDKPDSVLQLDVSGGRVHCVYIVRNPDKLLHLAAG